MAGEEPEMSPKNWQLRKLVDDQEYAGLTRELARMNLPVNIYTTWVWKIDLHNLFHFLKLRMDPHAQYEIRIYAQLIWDQLVRPWVPLAAEAWDLYVHRSLAFSAPEQDILRDTLHVALAQVPGLLDYLKGRAEDKLSDRRASALIKKVESIYYGQE